MYALPAYFFAGALLFSRMYTGTWSTPSAFVTGAYLLSGLATLFFDPYSLAGFTFAHEWTSVMGYLAIIAICLLPAFAMRRPEPADLWGNSLMRLLLAVLAPLAWYAFLYQLPFAIKSLGQGAELTRTILNTDKVSPLPTSYFTTVAVGTSMFYPIYALAAVEGIARRRNPIFILSCLVGMLAALANGICFTSRDMFIWLALTFVYAYWVYSGILETSKRAALRTAMFLGAAACLAGLTFFTIQRFGYRDPLNSVLSYLGQQPYVFAEGVSQQRYFYGLSLKFPLVAEALGVYDETRRTTAYEWTFGGFAKDFYTVAGWKVGFGLAIAFAITLGGSLLASRRQMTPAYLIICYLYLQFMIQGVFFYRLGSPSGNQYHALMVLLVVGLAVVGGGGSPGPRAARGP